MKNSYRIIALAITLVNLSCEDKFYKKKFDINYSITNKTDTTIREIKVEANYGVRTWIFKNVKPGKTETLRFNIKRDVRELDGTIILTSFFNETDSVFLGLAYYTNWYYLDTNPASYNIYRDRIEKVE